jgi:predicted DNA-binding protein with PD1-like motif
MLKQTLSAAIFALTATCFITIAKAQENAIASVVVNKTTCDRLANTSHSFILVLNSGDNLLESITRCAKDANLTGAVFDGLGQVHNPALAYFTSNPTDKPTITTFPGYYELASISGNVSMNDGVYYTHAHAVLADKKFHGIAGHVNYAKVGLTAEIAIRPLNGSVQRTLDDKTAFGPIVH